MELYFLILLVVIMIAALTSGFPVAFSLPGAAILTIAAAALCGFLFEGDVDAYFALGGPNSWLSAGVTNFRSLYWNVERDTLIAIPLFIFMGIMLQRSKIAEDLLVAMAQLFGPIPGGLGISVVFVGALLAATTGIVGATVIAMGLISLPAMLKNNYSKSLACGTICASGTLGQIIPPSIVLIILADQLSSAADQAGTLRQAAYKATTGEMSMPGEFAVITASAGDMFMGAFIPGLILVGLYMAYILISALVKPDLAPPMPFEGEYDRAFIGRVLLALMPPLTLIFIVLGSIILGVATVNQAGAIGAIGAMIMGSYRLMAGKPRAYYPAILAIVSIVAILVLLSFFDLNVKNITTDKDAFGVVLALIAVTGLITAIIWSIWRSYKIEDTLSGVMIETAKTTSMVFIILLGAAMLTSAFRAFGGEELVREYLTSLPGGFWTQFVVVMAVIFFLGFFLDFIEIAVVVVPIVAPILLADPQANVTAVWLGVMIGLNIQTSFLTPPFGFALFYLRGVAPKSVKTTHIYKGAVAFIGLQLLGLAIAGSFPSLVNYLPNKTHLTSETAPPPSNPNLQLCMEKDLFLVYDEKKSSILASIGEAKQFDTSYFPSKYRTELNESYSAAERSFDLIRDIRTAKIKLDEIIPGYELLHREVRAIQGDIRSHRDKAEHANKERQRLSYEENTPEEKVIALDMVIEKAKLDQVELEKLIPEQWGPARKEYVSLAKAEKMARQKYRRNADESYETLVNVQKMVADSEPLKALGPELEGLKAVIRDAEPKQAMETIKAVGAKFDTLKNAHTIKSKLSKARRFLRAKKLNRDKALAHLDKAIEALQQEVSWRSRAAKEFSPSLEKYQNAIRRTIGLRLQERLTLEQAKSIATCQSVHKDISLNF